MTASNTGNHTFITLHALENTGPNCMNRDGSGSPKTVRMGGRLRHRVSSQSWKRAMREFFKNTFADNPGIRTKKPVMVVANAIQETDPSISRDHAEEMAREAMKRAGLDIKAPKKSKVKAGSKAAESQSEEDPGLGTGAMIFISSKQAKHLAELIVSNTPKGPKGKNPYETALKEDPSVDIALFGRMIAAKDNVDYDSDACCQVAHAISTHEVYNEFDYFTAVDDLADENSGAAHVDTSEFCSSTLYRYAAVDITRLEQMVGEITPEAIAEFVKSFIMSIPSGKINSFANHILPSYIYVTIQEDIPLSFVGAFDNPVRDHGGYLAPSIERLETHAKKFYAGYGITPKRAYVFTTEGSTFDKNSPVSVKSVTMPELLETVQSDVRKIVGVES